MPSVTSGAAAPTRTQLSLSTRTWLALGGAFLVLTLLLGLTAVTLISQRQRTVLLNRQLATLVGEATSVIRSAGPALEAVPAHSSTIRSRADTLAGLVSQAGPLVAQLRSTGFPGTLASAGRLVASLQQQGRLVNALDNVGTLAADANRAALVGRLGQLLNELPAASALIAQLGRLATQVERYRVIPKAAAGLSDIPALLRLQTRALRVNLATLDTGRSARDIASQTLQTARTTLTTAQRILTIAEQTLTHAESLDRKVVGPVP